MILWYYEPPKGHGTKVAYAWIPLKNSIYVNIPISHIVVVCIKKQDG